MTIKEAQELIETWTAKNNVRNNELTNMALLTEVDLTVSLINALERKSNQQSHLSSPKKK